MNHLTKTILKIIPYNNNKIRPKAAVAQYGFSRSKGTRNVILVIRTLAENIIKVHKDIYMFFAVYEHIRLSEI